MTLILTIQGGSLHGTRFRPEAGGVLTAVVSAPLIEESTKGLSVLVFWFFPKGEFDDVLDGIVYAGFIALGFATVENVLYYGRSFVYPVSCTGYRGFGSTAPVPGETFDEAGRNGLCLRPGHRVEPVCPMG